MKKIIALILIITTLLCLVACGKKVSDAPASESNGENPYNEDGDKIISESVLIPKCGDQVILSSWGDVVWRVIADEGQAVDIDENDVYIDGVRFTDTEPSKHYTLINDRTVEWPIVIPVGNIFVISSGYDAFCGCVSIESVTYIIDENGNEIPRVPTIQSNEISASVSISIATVGDTVTFGSYGKEISDEKFPIEWIVLDIQNGKALLLSKYVLDAQKFHDKLDTFTWQSSYIRGWLNETFYNKAFSEAEKSSILLTTNANPGSYDFYQYMGGNKRRS